MNTYTLADTDLMLFSRNKTEDNRQYVLKIRDLPIEQKPREKLIAQGPKALSINELLAVVLTTGTRKEDVLAMSNRIIRGYGEKSLIAQIDPTKVSEELGIPLGKACQIVACAELGRRFYDDTKSGTTIIRTAKDVHQYLKEMHDLPKEYLRGIYLNTHNRVIHSEVLSIGTINSNLIHPREVFKPAIQCGAVAVILAHNHPSGITTPSDSDIEVTKQLVSAGKIIGIHLLDHVILAKNKFQSIRINYE